MLVTVRLWPTVQYDMHSLLSLSPLCPHPLMCCAARCQSRQKCKKRSSGESEAIVPDGRFSCLWTIVSGWQNDRPRSASQEQRQLRVSWPLRACRRRGQNETKGVVRAPCATQLCGAVWRRWWPSKTADCQFGPIVWPIWYDRLANRLANLVRSFGQSGTIVLRIRRDRLAYLVRSYCPPETIVPSWLDVTRACAGRGEGKETAEHKRHPERC